MGTIYKNTHLTLAARAFANGGGGLFVNHDGDFASFKLPQNFNSKISTLKARRKRRHTAFHFDGDPLSGRAWAYQERLQSQLILHLR
jgi:hypothetical protein